MASMHPESSANIVGSQGVSFDVQGHRGARGLLPENTLAGFRKALDLGVRTLETDVVITRDGEVVLSHDPWFSSEFSAAPGGERIRSHAQYAHRIFEMDYDTVCSYDCGLQNRRFPRQEAMPAHKPLLREMIRDSEAHARAAGRPAPFYNIETKSSPAGDHVLHPNPEEFMDRLIGVVEDEAVLDRTTIQSFDPRTLRILRRRRTPVQTSLLIARGDFLGVAADLQILGYTPDVYSPDFHLMSEALVAAAHARGMRVLPWTVNQLHDMRRMREMGADGIITDYPDVARDAW